jgi:hypothetical protein
LRWSAPCEALAAVIERLGNPAAKTIHISTDHLYSDHRIALQEAVLDFLSSQSKMVASPTGILNLFAGHAAPQNPVLNCSLY